MLYGPRKLAPKLRLPSPLPAPYVICHRQRRTALETYAPSGSNKVLSTWQGIDWYDEHSKFLSTSNSLSSLNGFEAELVKSK